MKVILTTPIVDLEGVQISEGNPLKGVTIKDTLLTSLLGGGRKEEDSTKKYARYCLLTDIKKAEKEIELSSEQVSDLKSLANEVYPILIYGQVWDILENKK
jgi:hypothetical protein